MPRLTLYAGTDHERAHDCTFDDLVTYDQLIDRTPDGKGPKTREQAAEQLIDGKTKTTKSPRRGRGKATATKTKTTDTADTGGED